MLLYSNGGGIAIQQMRRGGIEPPALTDISRIPSPLGYLRIVPKCTFLYAIILGTYCHSNGYMAKPCSMYYLTSITTSRLTLPLELQHQQLKYIFIPISIQVSSRILFIDFPFLRTLTVPYILYVPTLRKMTKYFYKVNLFAASIARGLRTDSPCSNVTCAQRGLPFILSDANTSPLFLLLKYFASI